jgi:hypothetical protein
MLLHKFVLLVIELMVFGFSFAKESCHTVKEGAHYSSLIPFHGFTNTDVQFSWIKFDRSSAKYLFKPDDNKGHLCSTSWNKLFGSARCGLINDPHKDSDRFVWRRAQSCLKFNGEYVVGEKEDCVEADLIELAAYAYDNGDKPFENQGRLLKEFKYKVKVNEWYGYRLRIYRTFTVYELLDLNENILESISIDHRDCGNFYNQGTNLRFYFGGQCPAPSQVDACYKTEL